MKPPFKVGDRLSVEVAGPNAYVDQHNVLWIEIGADDPPDGKGVYVVNGITGTLRGSVVTVDEIEDGVELLDQD